MIYSEIQEEFGYIISDDVTLSAPEEYLGQNWETVLHFWRYIGSLKNDQLDVVSSRFFELPENDVYKDEIAELCRNVCDYSEEAGEAAWRRIRHLCGDQAAVCATLELICMHILLEKGKKLVFVPLFVEL
jgi:hypothetical protein